MTDHPHDGGHSLTLDDPRVIQQTNLVEKLTSELKRLNDRNEVRTAAWREAGYTLQAVELWLRDGKPSVDHESETPRLLKGESITDAIERLRRRTRELRADLHRIRSAPRRSTHRRDRHRECRGCGDEIVLPGLPAKVVRQARTQGIVWSNSGPLLHPIHETGTLGTRRRHLAEDAGTPTLVGTERLHCP